MEGARRATGVSPETLLLDNPHGFGLRKNLEECRMEKSKKEVVRKRSYRNHIDIGK